MNTRWYPVISAQVAIYTDEKGNHHTENIVSVGLGCIIKFEYPKDGEKAMLIREGSKIRFNENGPGKDNVADIVL